LPARYFPSRRYRTLADRARETLARLGYANVTVLAGDGLEGLPAHAPYDRIMVTAAAEAVPEALVGQLASVVSCCCRSDSMTGRSVSCGSGWNRAVPTQQELIGVRFVPLLPGQGARIVGILLAAVRVEEPLGLKLYLLDRCLTCSSVVAYE
jgi:protein-L-isoaspartate(D-aspartate) O-methyltransferase